MNRVSFFIAVFLLTMFAAFRKTVDVSNVKPLVETNTELHAVAARGDTIVAVGGSRFHYGSIFVSHDAGQNWLRFDSISRRMAFCKLAFF